MRYIYVCSHCVYVTPKVTLCQPVLRWSFPTDLVSEEMVSAANVRELALVPVRGTVYVVKVPFVAAWMVLAYLCVLLYSIVAKIVSVPANLARRAARRIQLTWNWTKSSARAALPWKSNNNNGPGVTRTPGLELEEFSGDEVGLGLSRALRRRRGRKSHRKAIISSLIKILLEDPVSPPESGEETEILFASDDEDDKVYKLIRDLLQFSRVRPRSSSSSHSSSSKVPRSLCDRGLDVETLKQHARDKQKLEHLIHELDQYVKDMDAGSKAHQDDDDTSGTGRRVVVPSPRLNMHYQDHELLFTPDADYPTPNTGTLVPDAHAPTTSDTDILTSVSSNPDTDTYMDASEGEASGDEETGGETGGEYEEELSDEDDAPLHHGRGLSPVVEVSPELLSTGSTENLDKNYVCLESELNTALSRLSALTDELNDVEQFVLETKTTKATETVAMTSVPEARQGEDWSRKNSTSTGKSDSSFEDAADDFPGIPRPPPTLGIQAGHSRRKLAAARKTRPPTLAKGNQQVPNDGVADKDAQISSWSRENSTEFQDESSEEEEEDVTGTPSGLLPPSLSDQLQLLTPSSPSSSTLAHTPTPTQGKQAQGVADLYATVNKRASKLVRARSVGEVQTTPCPPRGRAGSFTDGAGGGGAGGGSEKSAAEKSLFMHDLTPPWKVIRSRNGSSNGSFDSTSTIPSAPLQEATPPPPPLPHRAYTPPTQHTEHQSNLPQAPQSPGGLYDKLPGTPPLPPPIPSKAGEEGLYDIIPSQKQHRYLHEKMHEKMTATELGTGQSWTPQLPPRNSTSTSTSMLKRTCSAEVMGSLVKDHDRRALTRHDSDRRSSTSSAREGRERSDPSSKGGRSSSTEGDQERERDRKARRERSSSDHHHHHHHHSRSSGRSSSEKDRSSSGRHPRSSDKTSSKSSSEGSGRHRASDKTASSSKPKSSSEGSSVWRIFSSAKSSSSKESSVKKEEEKEGRKGKDKEKKHSSSGSKESRSSSSSRTHRRKEEDVSIPRNESSSSLKSGVSMHSTDSSGRESLV